MPTHVSIIIPTFNEASRLPACLEALARQRGAPGGFEVLIVDGGSTDETVAVAEGFRDRLDLRVLDNARKDCGFGKVVGIHACAHDLVAFIDADVEVATEDWLERNVAAFLQLESRYAPLVVESWYLDDRRDPALSRHLTANLYISDPLAYAFVRRPVRVEERAAGESHAVVYRMPAGWPTGANGFFARKSLLLKHPFPLDRFDESNFFSAIAANEPLHILRVGGTGVYHHYVEGWGHYYRKRLKIGRKFFTRKSDGAVRVRSWVGDNGRARPILASLYMASVVFPLLESLYRLARGGRATWLLHPVAGLLCIVANVQALVEVLILRRRAW